MDISEHLIALEKALLTFAVRHSDFKLKQLIAPEFREIGASGAYFGRNDILQRLPKEQNWTAKVQDFECYPLADGLCQLVFKAFIKHQAEDVGTYSLRSSLWQKHADGWKVIFHQGTPVPPFELATDD